MYRVGVAPEDWKAACIVLAYKGKSERRDCANYKGISILSIPGSIYGRVMTSRVKAYELKGCM